MTSVLALCVALPALAQEGSEIPPKLFEQITPLTVTLTGPWREVTRNRRSDKRFPGTFSYTTASGQERVMAVEYQTRGLTRRDKICEFPPLKIFFDKAANKGTAFRGQSSLKLVSFCQSKKEFEQYNLLEYLAYRVYNLITPYSFRVRPLEATYLDNDSRRWNFTRFSFLIEDVDDLAERLGLEEVSIAALRPSELDPVETANYAVFQYFIANLDWAATIGPGGEECCHNGKLIGHGDDARPVFVIPYDFDSSGLVNADYALPPPQLGVSNIRRRLYRGFCAHNEQLPAAIDRFRAAQDDILDLFENQDGLSGRSRSQSRRLVESFYRTIEKADTLQEDLIDKCRG